MFLVRNHATGEYFVAQLAWSGGYSFEFDLAAAPHAKDGTARLYFRAGPDAPAPQRVIAPAESVRTPELHLGLVMGDFDHGIQAMHAHLRRSVFRPDGIVSGSERGERWLFWPMGVPEPGAMRQWGRHATAFVGRRHFDDPALLERYFSLGEP